MSSLDFYNEFNRIGQVLGAAGERQRIIASNVANAHTPNYTAKSISFSDVLGAAANPFETRLSQQMASQYSPLGPYDTGTPVNLQHEMMEMHKNSLYYNMATRRMSSIFNGLRSASQVGR